MRIQFAIRSLLLFALWVSPLAAGEAVRWAPSIEVAKMAASSKGQLVLIHFWGDNCPPCARLEAQVYNQPAFAESLERDYVPVKINASQNPEIAQQFQVDRWPQDVIITPSGQFVYRMISPQEVDRYTDVLAQVAGKASESATQVAQAGPSGPSAGSAPAAGVSRYSKYSSGEAGPGSNPTQPPAAQASRFAATQQGPGASPAAQPPAAPQAGAKPPQGMFVSGPPPAADPAKGSGERPQGKPDQPEFALDGYCPVTLIEQQSWKKGDRRFGAVHLGKVYLFGSEIDQKKFLATPNKYSPVLSGLDAVTFVTEGRQTEGDRRYGLTYYGTLYLFSSEDNLQRFWNDPKRYQAAVEQAMSGSRTRR